MVSFGVAILFQKKKKKSLKNFFWKKKKKKKKKSLKNFFGKKKKKKRNEKKKKRNQDCVSILNVVLQTPQSCEHVSQSSKKYWQIESPHCPFDFWLYKSIRDFKLWTISSGGVFGFFVKSRSWFAKFSILSIVIKIYNK